MHADGTLRDPRRAPMQCMTLCITICITKFIVPVMHAARTLRGLSCFTSCTVLCMTLCIKLYIAICITVCIVPFYACCRDPLGPHRHSIMHCIMCNIMHPIIASHAYCDLCMLPGPCGTQQNTLCMLLGPCGTQWDPGRGEEEEQLSRTFLCRWP